MYNKRRASSCSPPALASEDEEYDDVTVSQMLSPKKEEMDATQILNNLLKEYDKKLRPDIGGEWTSPVPVRTSSWFLLSSVGEELERYTSLCCVLTTRVIYCLYLSTQHQHHAQLRLADELTHAHQRHCLLTGTTCRN